MIFLEVDDIQKCDELLNKRLHNKYKLVKLSEMEIFEWGKESFMHDPPGVLWQFGEFNK
jgi:hypothetical protein